MEKHTGPVAPYPTDQWGLSLSENGSANLHEAVLTYQETPPSHYNVNLKYAGKKN